MGVELDLSELAVLRPIQTAATTTAARPRGDDADGPDAADTGCVTPTAKSSLLPRLGLGGGGLDNDAAAAVTACVTPTSSPCLLPPLGLGGGLLDIDAAAAVAACVTPTASPCLLRPATECPPAPRKPARPPPPTPDNNKRKRCCVRPGLQRAFFPVPHDLSTVFVPRGPADRRSPPPSPPRAAKKIRLDVIG